MGRTFGVSYGLFGLLRLSLPEGERVFELDADGCKIVPEAIGMVRYKRLAISSAGLLQAG